jgi:hypothetical protein
MRIIVGKDNTTTFMKCNKNNQLKLKNFYYQKYIYKLRYDEFYFLIKLYSL